MTLLDSDRCELGVLNATSHVMGPVSGIHEILGAFGQNKLSTDLPCPHHCKQRRFHKEVKSDER